MTSSIDKKSVVALDDLLLNSGDNTIITNAEINNIQILQLRNEFEDCLQRLDALNTTIDQMSSGTQLIDTRLNGLALKENSTRHNSHYKIFNEEVVSSNLFDSSTDDERLSFVI